MLILGSLLLTKCFSQAQEIDVFALPDSNTDTIIVRSGRGRCCGDGPNR
jgi:hypothetical protein